MRAAYVQKRPTNHNKLVTDYITSRTASQVWEIIIYKSATAEAGSTQFVSEPLAFHAAGASLKVYIHINIYRGHLLARALHVSAEQRRGAVAFNFETNDLAVVSRDVAQHSHHLAEHSFFMCVSLALGDNHFRILGVLHTTQPFRSYNNCHSSDGCNCARALESCVCVCVCNCSLL